MGAGGEYGGGTDKRESYESREHDEEGLEREEKDLPDDLERDIEEYNEKADEIAKELERELEDEERSRNIADELESEMEHEGSPKEVEDESRKMEGFENDLGHDLEETQEDLHDEFVNDIERQLEGSSTKEATTDDESTENDSGTSSEMTESSESYQDDGNGMAYALESKDGSAEAEADTETETEQEAQEQSEPSTQEPVEQQAESEAAEESLIEKGTNRITPQKSEEGEAATSSEAEETQDDKTSGTKSELSETEEDEPEISEGHIESEPKLSKENQQDTGEFSEVAEAENEQSTGTVTETIEPDVGTEVAEQAKEDASESNEDSQLEPMSHEETEVQKESTEHGEPIDERIEGQDVDTESQENECTSEDDFPYKDLEDFVRRVQDILDEKMDTADDYDYVQDPLTGEIQRVPKILTEYETEEQRRRRKLRNLFAELSEDERERFKEIVRENTEGEKVRSAEAVEKQWSRIVEKAEQDRGDMIDTHFKTAIEHDGSIKDTDELSKELLAKISESKKRVSFLELNLDGMNKEKIKSLTLILEERKAELERDIRKRLGMENTEARIGVVDNRVYLWTTENSRNDMLNAWSKQYYYFKQNGVLKHLQESALRNLRMNPRSSESKTHFNKLMNQILCNTDDEKLKKSRHLKENRIQGESLKFLLDSMGLDTKFLENKIAKITGIKGQGGLENPSFPSGEKLEILRARIIGTIVSDCQVRGSKGLMYYESSEERINRFEKTLRNFGDIHLKRKFRKSRGVYELYINSAMSEAAIFWGIPVGDRTILNYGLPSDVHKWSKKSQRALIQDMFSQEGCVSENGEISWNRRHALCAGNKSERYNFQSKLSSDSIRFLKESKEANRDYEKGNAGEIYLTIGQLERFQNDSDRSKADMATKILKVVNEHRNRLIDDEVEIVRGLGIKVTVSAMQVSYYKRSGRVSVRWQARIRDRDSMMQCAIQLRPNDSLKATTLDNWMLSQNHDNVRKTQQDVKEEEF